MGQYKELFGCSNTDQYKTTSDSLEEKKRNEQKQVQEAPQKYLSYYPQQMCKNLPGAKKRETVCFVNEFY